MTWPRRAVLGGAAALVMAGRALARPASSGLHEALDAAARDKSPKAALDRLAGFDDARLTSFDRLDLRTARAGLAIDAELARRFSFGRAQGLHPYRVTPFDGAWRAATPDSAAIDEDTRAIEADARAGVMLPHPWLEQTMAAIDRRGSLDEPVRAALERQRAALSALQSRSYARQGLAQVPGGRRWYELLCARTLGEPGSLASCEARLTARRDALHRQAMQAFARIGVRETSVGACFQRLWSDPAHLYPDDESGRAQAVADMTRHLGGIRAMLGQDFGPIPGWCLDVSVRALSAQDVAQGRKGYREVPAPGRPGAYVVDLQTIRLRPGWSLPAVVAHELLPGHMIQLGLEGQRPPHALRRLYAGSFVEGWGIYAEHLAEREGAYAQPLARLGYLHWQLFRVCRALVDLGIHLHGWSKAQARARLEAWQGVAAYFAPFDQDLDRIALDPGLRLAEGLAALAIGQRAATLSGTRLRAFHRRMVQDGSRRIDDLAAE